MDTSVQACAFMQGRAIWMNLRYKCPEYNLLYMQVKDYLPSAF